MSEPNDLQWYLNSSAKQWNTGKPSPAHTALGLSDFHKSFPGYKPTPLKQLPASIAHDLGVRAIFIKEEADRLGLPSFKILGASWATFRLLAERFGLDVSKTSLDEIASHARAYTSSHDGLELELVAATDGNHGRAVARMASILCLKSRIFVPVLTPQSARDNISSENGATIKIVNSHYDDAILEAAQWCEDNEESAIFVQDTSLDDYTIVPNWIIEGYTTLFTEIDTQLEGHHVKPDLVIVPAGVGSLAHSCVRHYQSTDFNSSPSIMVVESTGAPCLNTSLKAGKVTTITTTDTIMAGLNCPTPSPISFPDLLAGVEAAVAVSDQRSREALEDLEEWGVNAGPCGAATFAAARAAFGGTTKEAKRRRADLGLDQNSTIVLVSTEGSQTYRASHPKKSEPGNIMDRSAGNITESLGTVDPVALAQALIRIDSANPDLSLGDGATGEAKIASFIESWLNVHIFEVHRLEKRPGRPTIIGVARGSGGEGAKSLMFNGHIDTVTLAGYNGDPLSGEIVDGKLHGRGAYDMKAGVAAFLVAATTASAKKSLRGDIIVACVADEEYASSGTEELIENGWRADGAIVPEPTQMELALSHRGFAWAEVDIIGVAAHGSRPDLGVDAIVKAGHFLVELDKYAERLATRSTARGGATPDSDGSLSGLERGSVHASLIQGGEEPSSYPAKCTITVERRTVQGETPETVHAELKGILNHLVQTVPSFKYELRISMSRPPFQIDENHELVKSTIRSANKILGTEVKKSTALFWTDCALLAESGTPALLLGVSGVGAHAATEYADVSSIQQLTQILTNLALDFCS